LEYKNNNLLNWKIRFDSFEKKNITKINRRFENGVIRDEGYLNHITYKTSRTKGVNRKAATPLVEIATNHPFFDGNKRTAIKTTKVVLSLHGREIIAKNSASFDLVFRITSQRYTIDETTIWIANHTK